MRSVVWLRSRYRRDLPKRDLLRPCFEELGMPRPLLWACRIWYRAALRRELLREPAEALRDFSVTPDALRAYLGRWFWEP